jgi:hypothetical protein
MRGTQLKTILNFFGIDTHKFLFAVFGRNAERLYRQKVQEADERIRNLIEQEDERYHLADIELPEEGSQYAVKTFTLDRIRFLRTCCQDTQGTIADLGDSNGIFLRSLDRDGISVNISDPAVRSLKSRGMDVVKADIEYLPFKTGSIPLILLFETLEHVPNPIGVLGGLERVCTGRVILSVPRVTRTRIHPYGYDPHRPVHQHHIFEFDREDLVNIISHTAFRIRKDAVSTVLGDGGFGERLMLWAWNRFFERDMFCGCFRQFYICELVKDAGHEPVRSP